MQMEHSDADVFLKATLARIEPNLEEIALTAGTSLGAAAARGFTDMAITGSDTSETVFLTTKTLRSFCQSRRKMEHKKVAGRSTIV